MGVDPEDARWFLRWAVILDRLKAGAITGEAIELTPGECTTLLRGVHALSENAGLGEG